MRHPRLAASLLIVVAAVACSGERVPPIPETVDVSSSTVPPGTPLPAPRDSAAADSAPVVTARVGEFRAAGNEPFWGVVINADAITIRTPQVLEGVAFPPQLAEVRGNSFHWSAETAQPNRHTIEITITRGACHDTMADKIWTHRAVVTYDGKELVGCAEGGGVPGSAPGPRQ